MCECGSGLPGDQCCTRLLAGAPAPTALSLMRSRYTAYVRGDIDYLMRTHHGSPDRAGIEKWARESRWLGLEIVAVERGGASDDEGVVEFIARGTANGEPFVHDERSRFRRVDGQWKYLDGPAPKAKAPGRNDPCPCGSGKKYKRCHYR
jgi:SEC-C motif-containing protein